MWLTSDQRLWDPLETVSQIREEMNRLFRERYGDARKAPLFNIWTKENEAVVTTELPGVNAQDIEISVEGNTLTLRGTRKWDEPGDEDVVHRVECFNGEFSRTVELPFRVNAERIQASHSKGILTITLPRVELDRPKKIQVKAA